MAEITIGTGTYEAFISVEDADAYLAADISRALAWAGLDDDAKGRALVSATRMLLAMPWCAEVPDPAEAQPEPLPSVTAMLAADLAASPDLFADASGNSNIKRAKAGSAEVEFFSPVDGGPPLPLALWNILLSAGLMCPNGNGGDTTLDGAIPSGICGGHRPLGGRWPWDWPIAKEDYD
jgi:hypothetical protein